MQRDGTLGVEFEVVSRQPGTEYVITAIKPGENGRVWIEVEDVSATKLPRLSLVRTETNDNS